MEAYMPSNCTPDQNNIPPTHQDFHWIEGPGRTERFADFIEQTRDIAAGVNSALQIIYSSDLAREINAEVDPDYTATPAVGSIDCANLLRLSLAATALLRNAADEHIAALEQPN
jgi:hypothetical protein